MPRYTLSVKGSRQGDLKGETGKNQTRIPILGFDYGVKSSRAPSTGQASGKHQHTPVTIYKEWGVISPQMFEALVTNENLISVVIDELRTDPQGKEEVYMEIRLTNAVIVEIEIAAERLDDQPVFTEREIEQVSFAFQKIEIENKISRVVAVDDLGSKA